MSYSQVITYGDNTDTALTYDFTVIQLADPHLKLQGPAPYATTNPSAVTLNALSLTHMSAFAESATKPAGTEIKYQVILGNTSYRYDSSLTEWVVADGTYATANTATEVNAGALALFNSSPINLTTQFLRLRIFLHTSDDTVTPSLTSNTFTYQQSAVRDRAINLCAISASLSDLTGVTTPPTTAKPAYLHVSAPYGFMHTYGGSRFIQPFTQSVPFDANGNVVMSVIETETPGVALKFSITYYDGESVKTTQFVNAVVPNLAAINLCNLTSVVPYDFG